MCNRLQVITSLPVCAKRAVTYVRHWNNLFLGLSPWRDVMCDMLCMLGEAAVRGLIDCIFKICTKMDVRWSKGCDIPTSESSHVQPLTSYNFTSGVC